MNNLQPIAEIATTLLEIPAVKQTIGMIFGDLSAWAMGGVRLANAKRTGQLRLVEAETQARVTVLNAMGEKTAELVAKDPSIEERMRQRMLSQETQKQSNLEGVATLMLEHLSDVGMSPEAAAPSQDFMNVFTSHAEKASSEDMRDKWARILAGEINKPGSFSLRAIHLMSIVDQPLAKIIEEIRPQLIDDSGLLVTPEWESPEGFKKLLILEEIGFLNRGLSLNYTFNEHGRSLMCVGDFGILCTGQTGTKFALQSVCKISVAGQEIAKIIPNQVSKLIVMKIAQHIRNSCVAGQNQRMFVGQVQESQEESGIQLINIVEIFRT